MESRTWPLFRILTSGIFLLAGLQHLLHPDAVAARLAAAPGASLVTGLASPVVLVILAGIALLAGGLALALGFATRAAAVGLAAVLIPITLTVQTGEGTYGPLMKNVAIFGALTLLAAHGGGSFSLDALLGARVRRLAPAAVAVLALALGFVPFLAGDAHAAPKPAAKVLLLVQQPPQLLAAIKTGTELLAGKGFPASDVEVLVCGPGIASLVTGSPAEPQLADAKMAGVRVVGCGLSLTEKGIDRTTVSPHVTLAENGFVEALQRKAEGYLSVDL